ncbi:hypothetical protein QYE76_041120 [Lolium multiflorum]|uniref:Uncharacterized protein n=1 Tax=Lolium multiflorum TaxID=4521 RepID=A0AAD8TEC5_LOLMU|nr:hypothetical protein QYE76_041120 [Lolium multiflorum]
MEKKNAPAAVASEPVAPRPSPPSRSPPSPSPPPVAAELVAAERVASGRRIQRGSSVNWASLSADGPLHRIGECFRRAENATPTRHEASL